MGRTGLVLGLAASACLLSLAIVWVRPVPESPLPSQRVEVLNGCGVEGLAAATANQLQAMGQVVVRVDDAAHHAYDRTVLIDRAGRPWRARRLAQRLGSVLVVLERVEDPTADLTLILGRDHARALGGLRP